MSQVIYNCILCHKACTSDWDAPETWHWQRRVGPRVRCPVCGGACYPVPWREAAIQACDANEQLSLTVLEELWSACPNVSQCMIHGHYAGDCEEGLPVRPKCLVVLYRGIESLDKRLAALENKEPSRRAGRSAG